MFTEPYTAVMTAMLRVREDVRDLAADLARKAEVPIGELVGRALEAYERELFWQQTQEALLHDDTDDDEHRLWEVTLRDGLDDGDDDE